MELKPITSLKDALAVRKIRNECRIYMTNDQAEIGFLRQIYWYLAHYRKSKSYRVFLATDGGAVGYGALHNEGNTLHVTEGVAEKHRHKGYGTAILGSMIAIARNEKLPLVAEIWADNKASIGLHTKMGFKLDGTKVKSGEQINIYHV